MSREADNLEQFLPLLLDLIYLILFNSWVNRTPLGGSPHFDNLQESSDMAEHDKVLASNLYLNLPCLALQPRGHHSLLVANLRGFVLLHVDIHTSN